MKIELDDSELVDAIVEKVVERLKPLLNNSDNPIDEELMDVKGLAKYLKVKESWVYEKIHTREIPFKKIGKRFTRFLKRDIDAWIKNPYNSSLSHYNLKVNGKGVNIT